MLVNAEGREEAALQTQIYSLPCHIVLPDPPPPALRHRVTMPSPPTLPQPRHTHSKPTAPPTHPPPLPPSLQDVWH